MVHENPKTRFLSAWRKEWSMAGMRTDTTSKEARDSKTKTKQAVICFLKVEGQGKN